MSNRSNTQINNTQCWDIDCDILHTAYMYVYTYTYDSNELQMAMGYYREREDKKGVRNVTDILYNQYLQSPLHILSGCF